MELIGDKKTVISIAYETGAKQTVQNRFSGRNCTYNSSEKINLNIKWVTGLLKIYTTISTVSSFYRYLQNTTLALETTQTSELRIKQAD